jgi:hypothetical protein
MFDSDPSTVNTGILQVSNMNLLYTDQYPLDGKNLFAFELKIDQLKFDMLAALGARELIALKVH